MDPLESLLAPYRRAVQGQDPDYERDPLYAFLAPQSAPPERPPAVHGSQHAGAGNLNGLHRKLYKGFMDAGRPDLAAMVGTPAFDTWIDQESSGDFGAVSDANNQGLPNGGGFQFWAGHDWAKPYFQGGTFTMGPRKQAFTAATKFNLTPDRIREFAKAIQSGTYKGWG